ncbi:ABC transporter substrate-binding protein [uncultured Tateyamaria sp.]|uniref:ABC transporter substrate-binding protein n=1 Tax=Tateyamaria sp. 1078 TaxID=3417464 RepID=UPI002603AAB3|nr:ABC transporter substrate-binding protein [uncultured Tateyamaria sp.]
MAETVLRIGYLRVAQPLPPTLSNLDPIPDKNGLAGAETGLADNLTTGKFLGQTYEMTRVDVAEGDDPLAAARDLLAASPYLVLDAAASDLLAIADLPEAAGAMLFNTSAGDLDLRDTACRANLFHTLASDAMRTDALAQVLVKRRWDDLVMITGTHPADISYAQAMRRSLTKFGLSLEAEKEWAFDADMRRTASQEVPLFTQDFGDYDALIIADEVHDFGRYVLYNTWEARPVVGSEGLTAVGWSPVIEQWGAAQLQSRFEEQHQREMTAQDYAAWAALRTLGEALTRTNATDPETLRAYILSDAFELAGFKGRPLTYRDWNGQLRQPIAVAHPRALVAQAPLDGFLHQINELDSLGLDRPESKCEAFQ